MLVWRRKRDLNLLRKPSCGARLWLRRLSPPCQSPTAAPEISPSLRRRRRSKSQPAPGPALAQITPLQKKATLPCGLFVWRRKRDLNLLRKPPCGARLCLRRLPPPCQSPTAAPEISPSLRRRRRSKSQPAPEPALG